jgi:hypothetical protein
LYITGVRCKPLDEIENGRIEVTPFNRLGAKAKYVCDEGYMMMGGSERQCQGDGIWSREAPTCEGDCKLQFDFNLCRTRHEWRFSEKNSEKAFHPKIVD